MDTITNQVTNWEDHDFVSTDRTIFTNALYHIPGLSMFGKQTMRHAVDPIIQHYHAHRMEIVFVTKGSIQFCTKDKEYDVAGGDIFITRPDEIHSADKHPLSIGEMFWLQLDLSDPNHFLYLCPESASYLIDALLRLPHHVVKYDSLRLQRKLKTLFLMLSTPDNRYMAASHIATLLHDITRYSGQVTFQITPDIVKCITYIDTHLTQDIPLDFLALYSNLSLSQFKQKFKDQIGISPRTYINQKKIEKAKDLLSLGKSITATAMSLGFNSSSYFATVFKRHTLTSPSEYQRHSI